MLKPCPECEMQVSDKATICPHCGFPLHSGLVSTVRKSRRRHARLPNGFGRSPNCADAIFVSLFV